MTNFERVKEFHRAFGQQVAKVPTLADGDVESLRLKLIDEEVVELDCALAEEDIVEVADALTDILYVVYGMADIYGIPIDACFDAVHRSNMAKLDENGKPILRAVEKLETENSRVERDLRSAREDRNRHARNSEEAFRRLNNIAAVVKSQIAINNPDGGTTESRLMQHLLDLTETEHPF